MFSSSSVPKLCIFQFSTMITYVRIFLKRIECNFEPPLTMGIPLPSTLTTRNDYNILSEISFFESMLIWTDGACDSFRFVNSRSLDLMRLGLSGDELLLLFCVMLSPSGYTYRFINCKIRKSQLIFKYNFMEEFKRGPAFLNKEEIDAMMKKSPSLQPQDYSQIDTLTPMSKEVISR